MGTTKDLSSNASKLATYAEGNWTPNVTMVDLDWERARSEELGELHEPFLEHDATSFDTSFEIRKSSEKSSSLGDYAVAVFEEITEALDALEGRIVLETSCDEITHTLEQVSYGLLDGRDEQVQTQGVAQQFPQLYDRIHMSNIPDYIGGSLANFLLAVPAITSSSDAFITSCSLRNPSRFSSYRLYHNEYAIANTAEQIEKLFQVRESDTEEIPVFPVMGYRNYHKTQQKALSFPELLPRNEIEIWLHRHFLKLVLPLARDFTSWTMICAPLNLSVFFRLLEHLHRVGYPAHWLSSVLSDLLVGSITTRARAPRSDPLSIAEVNTALTERKQSIAPFLTELATLSAIWEPVLPFGSVESTRLPDPHHIYRHTIRFEKAVLNGGK